MSLIQEALKRQQQEYGTGPTQAAPSTTLAEPPVTEAMPVMEKPAPTDLPAPTVRPLSTAVVPPPLPPPLPSSIPPGVSSSRPWVKIGGMAVAALVILVVGGLITAKWVFKATRTQAVPQQAVQPAPPAPAAAVKAEPVAAGVEQAAAQPVLPGPAPAAPAPLPTEASVPPAPAPTGKAGPSPASKPKAAVAALQWPSLKLTGILASPDAGEGAARINNQMIYVGGQVNGVMLIEIRADGVMLKYGEETRFLKMGGMIY